MFRVLIVLFAAALYMYYRAGEGLQPIWTPLLGYCPCLKIKRSSVTSARLPTDLSLDPVSSDRLPPPLREAGPTSVKLAFLKYG